MPTADQVKAVQARRLHFMNTLWDIEASGAKMPTSEKVAESAGLKVTGNELRSLVDELARDQLVTGTKGLGGWIAIELAPAGRRLVEAKAHGAEPSAGSPASIGDIKIDGSGNVINISQHSAGAQQHVEITPFEQRKMLTWVKDVQARAADHGLGDDDLADVQEGAIELRTELERNGDTDNSKARKLGRSIVRILATTGGSLASAGLIEAGKDLFLT